MVPNELHRPSHMWGRAADSISRSLVAAASAGWKYVKLAQVEAEEGLCSSPGILLRPVRHLLNTGGRGLLNRAPLSSWANGYPMRPTGHGGLLGRSARPRARRSARDPDEAFPRKYAPMMVP